MHGSTRKNTQPFALVCLFACVAAAAGCTAPLQNGGVEVRAGAAERLGFLCRWRHGDVSAGSMCGANEARLPAARAGLMTDADRLRGPLAKGRAGDYRIANDEVAFVIDHETGDLVDAADARARCDELGALHPLAETSPDDLGEARITSGVEPDGAAWIDVKQRARGEASLAKLTRYALRPGDRALLVSTAIHNGSAASVGPLDLGDSIDWGSAEPTAAPPGETSAHLAGAGRSVAYALLAVDDSDFASQREGSTTRTRMAPATMTGPNETSVFERIFVVAPRGDTLAIATELFFLRGGSPGGIEIATTDEAGHELSLPSDAFLRFAPNDGGPALLLRAAPTDEACEPKPPASTLAAELPPGAYTIGIEGPGVRAREPVLVTVTEGSITHASVVASLTETVEAAQDAPGQSAESDVSESPR